MRADTKQKHEMGKRFAILIGVAAAGVMALGAQTASSTTGDPVDITPPDLQLSGPMSRAPRTSQGTVPRPGHRAATRAYSTFSLHLGGHGWAADEEFTVRATGKLTNVKMAKLAPDSTTMRAGGGRNR